MYNKFVVTYGHAIETTDETFYRGQLLNATYVIYSYGRFMAELAIFYKACEDDYKYVSIKVDNDIANFSVTSKKHFNAFLKRMMAKHPIEFSFDTNEQEYTVYFLED